MIFLVDFPLAAMDSSGQQQRNLRQTDREKGMRKVIVKPFVTASVLWARRHPLFNRILEKWVSFSLHLRIKPIELHINRNRYRQRSLLKHIGGLDHAETEMESEYRLHI